MGKEDRNLDLTKTPSSDVSLLIQRIHELQQEKERVARGKNSLSLSLRQIEKNIRSFLGELDIDDELFFVTESEGVESLVATLFVVIKSLQHDIECRRRDQKRLAAAVEASQKRAKNIEREKKILERENMELEVRVDVLENNLRKLKKRR